MKKWLFPIAAILFTLPLTAQEGVKKYVLIEHFTNSRCGICASKNPAFYNLIGQAQYASEIHHIAIHPKFPYPSCVFYQANTAENEAWTNLFPAVQGTPTIAINGVVQGSSTPLLSEAKLQTYLGQTSPLHLKVSESGPNNARNVTVDARAFGEIPAGDYKIYVAVLEKTINMQTPNGEPVHHDVFRKMLTAVAGDAFTVPEQGETVSLSYNFSIPAAWNANEVYVVAFVKNALTKEVLNSGTRFDPALVGTSAPVLHTLNIAPNPANNEVMITLPAGETAREVVMFTSSGRQVWSQFSGSGNVLQLPLSDVPPGVYYLKVTGEKAVYSGKFVKN